MEMDNFREMNYLTAPFSARPRGDFSAKSAESERVPGETKFSYRVAAIEPLEGGGIFAASTKQFAPKWN